MNGRGRARALAELVRAPAALTVPGDVLAGAAAARRPLRGRQLALAASSVGLYWAGMALNDWADRAEDATDRPDRPIPSGRVRPGQALALAAGLTALSLAGAAAAGGRRTLLHRALPLAGTVWAYDLVLKRTAAGPAAMAAARGLNVLLGAGPGRAREALPAAAAITAHTLAVTRLSRREVSGAARRDLDDSLGVTGAVGLATALSGGRGPAARAASVGGAALYLTGYGRAQLAARQTPGPPEVRSAVAAGIHSLLPLQAAWTARAGALPAAAALAAARPLASRLGGKVSPT